MYAKLMERITESSLMEEPIPVRYCFMMFLAVADPQGYAIGTDVALARRMNMPLVEFKKCVEELSKPDPDSNSRDHEGRRLVPSDSDRGYLVVNYRKYRDTRDAKHRREYMRDYMRDYMAERRAKPTAPCEPTTPEPVKHVKPVKPVKPAVKQPVNSVRQAKQCLANAEAEAEAEAKADAEKKVAAAPVSAPPPPAAPVYPEEFPPDLRSPEFLAAWDDYLTYRREGKMKVPKPMTVRAKLLEFAGWGEERAIDAIRETIKQGWQGVFEPKTPQTGRQAPQRTVPRDDEHF